MNIFSVPILTVVINDIRFNPFDIPKLRGYFSRRYAGFDLIHNHLKDNRFRYSYPSIQFKIIGSNPAIIGIGEGIDVLKSLFLDVDSIQIDEKQYVINEKSILLKNCEIGQTEKQYSYRFISPWMALNQENYRKFRMLSRHEKRPLLENILRGNLISLSKGLDYHIPNPDHLFVTSSLKTVMRRFKNNIMQCFTGSFETNFLIPDHLGIGKQTARGFGTVVRINGGPGKNGLSQ